jgi:hypothetical protein
LPSAARGQATLVSVRRSVARPARLQMVKHVSS